MAAKLLGIGKTILYRKLKELAQNYDQFGTRLPDSVRRNDLRLI